MVRRMIPYRIAQEKPMIKSCLKVFLSILLNANAIIGGMIDHANPLSFALAAHDRRDECATDGYVVEFVPELHATF